MNTNFDKTFTTLLICGTHVKFSSIIKPRILTLVTRDTILLPKTSSLVEDWHCSNFAIDFRNVLASEILCSLLFLYNCPLVQKLFCLTC